MKRYLLTTPEQCLTFIKNLPSGEKLHTVNPMSKQHCFRCWLDNPPKADNKCITNRLEYRHIYK